MSSEDTRGMRRKGRGAGPEPPGGNAKYGDDEGGTLHVHSVVLKLSTFYCQDISFILMRKEAAS